MEDNLRALLTRLREDSDLAVSVEEATRQAAVLPILSSLGWDWQNLREVVPEFIVGQGRVDYCLKQGDRNVAFVEVKRTGEPLEAHQEQLLGYAFREGVKLAVLTDGLAWWLYLPMQAGSWEQRKFFTIDVERQDPETAASHFRQFLQREAVFDGMALASAESVLRGHERSRAIERAMPEAWDQLRTGPDELLVELLSDAVEGLSGHRPDDEDVLSFLPAPG